MAKQELSELNTELVEKNEQLIRTNNDLDTFIYTASHDLTKFASNAAQVEKACRGYKDINLLAMQLLRPGGVLATFSCSELMTPNLSRRSSLGRAWMRSAMCRSWSA